MEPSPQYRRISHRFRRLNNPCDAPPILLPGELNHWPYRPPPPEPPAPASASQSSSDAPVPSASPSHPAPPAPLLPTPTSSASAYPYAQKTTSAPRINNPASPPHPAPSKTRSSGTPPWQANRTRHSLQNRGNPPACPSQTPPASNPNPTPTAPSARNSPAGSCWNTASHNHSYYDTRYYSKNAVD